MSSERFHPAANGNRCGASHPNIGWSLGSLVLQRVGRKTGGPEEDRDSTVKPTESTNLDP